MEGAWLLLLILGGDGWSDLSRPNSNFSVRAGCAIPSTDTSVEGELAGLGLFLAREGEPPILTVRGISNFLQGMTIDQVLSLFALAIMDYERYLGLTARYLQGDTYLVGAIVYSL